MIQEFVNLEKQYQLTNTIIYGLKTQTISCGN